MVSNNRFFRALALLIGLGVTLLVPADSLVSAQATGVLDERFGLIEPHDAPEYAGELGVGWGRARFHWGRIQPDGPDDWIEAELTGAELTRELEAGREVVGILIGLPDWATGEDGLPRGLYLPIDDPGNTWAVFVRQAVARYQGRIDHWVIWNEPDVWDPAHPGFTWPGDEADYLQLLKVAYLTAKAANPDAVIHLAAVSHWWDVQNDRELYFRRFLDVLVADPGAEANHYYYDAATLHLYFNPADVYDLLELYRGIQLEHGIDKPIWLVETNAAPSSDPYWPTGETAFQVSLLEQAAYMPQGLALALAGGAERVGIYKLVDTPDDLEANPEPFGLVRADGSTRPAYLTTQVAIRQLAGAERVTWSDRHIVSQVVVEKPGQVIRLFWSRIPSAQTISVPALGREAHLVDMWGNVESIQSTDGSYQLTLFGGECQQTTGDYCMIGGPPVYLVEDIPLDAVPDGLSALTFEIVQGEGRAFAPLVSTQTLHPLRQLVPWLVLGAGGLVLGAAVILFYRGHKQ